MNLQRIKDIIWTFRNVFFLLIIILFFGLFFSRNSFLSLANDHQKDVTKDTLRVLFIGNSLTHYNNGVPSELISLCYSSIPRILIQTEMVAVGGERLSGHYKKGEALRLIRNNKYDIVVLQEYTNYPISNKEEFYNYSRIFYNEIQESGAETVFYMTWNYKNNLEMSKLIADAYENIADELKCKVVPVGVAWKKCLKEMPELDLYCDYKHPNYAGTYLAACCFYSAFSGRSPEGLPYINLLSVDEALYLQKLAYETVKNWKQK